MDKNSQNIAWILFGIFFGTFVSNWLYFLTVGIIGLLCIFYIEHLRTKIDAVEKEGEQ